MNRVIPALVAAALLAAPAARAAVIAGPTLNSTDFGYTVTGLEITAVTASTLTGFTFVNQGQADTVVLTDSAGNVLQSLSTPAGTPSYTASVSWDLTAGDSYWLLQTTASNAIFAVYNQALPSNADIAVSFAGVFSMSIAAAITGDGWGATEYWNDFNAITTSSNASSGSGSDAPEPASLALLGAGLAGLGLLRRRRG